MKILLTTLNARYAHTSLGLRYLYANLGEHQPNATICEYTLDQRPIDIVEQLLAYEPDVISLGVYIWNIHQSEAIAKMLKAVRPEITLIIGGPEVSHEHHLNSIVDVVDYVICGWGEASLPQLLSDLENKRPPVNKIISGIKLPLDQIRFPYDYYTDTDLAQRILYVEASRGCPFTCEFCISSLDEGVQAFNIDAFLAEMEKLFARGARTFKFVDRTFNIKLENSKRILQFFLDKVRDYPQEGIFAHFEVVPDYLPQELRILIQAFPKGALQLEIGIQTLNRDVQRNISRRTHLEKAKESIYWLSTQTGAHLHVDLIAGLPGEDLASFAKGFNELWSWQPQEIQLGILKRLKGTPIARHTEPFEFIYDSQAPFAALKNKDLSFAELQHINRLSRFWDLIINSGRFPHTTPLILGETPFENMWELSDWIFNLTKQTYKIALDRLIKLIFDWLISKGLPEQEVIALLSADFMTMGIQGWPHYLGAPPQGWRAKVNTKGHKGTVRQDRHMVGN